MQFTILHETYAQKYVKSMRGATLNLAKDGLERGSSNALASDQCRDVCMADDLPVERPKPEFFARPDSAHRRALPKDIVAAA